MANLSKTHEPTHQPTHQGEGSAGLHVRVPAGGDTLEGEFTVSQQARGIVLFAHGSGSSRHSPRNRYVAQVLQQGALGTLLFDLLTEKEEAIDSRSGEFRFDIELLAERLLQATEWVAAQPQGEGRLIGYFGASTGAAAALVAAAQRPRQLAAVVSRGGRPDLAGSSLPYVQAPTLLIVGGEDSLVLNLNRWAMAQLRCRSQLAVIAGATHLFQEPGTLEQAANLASSWFAAQMPGPGASRQ